MVRDDENAEVGTVDNAFDWTDNPSNELGNERLGPSLLRGPHDGLEGCVAATEIGARRSRGFVEIASVAE
jgi:hypothetical protein